MTNRTKCTYARTTYWLKYQAFLPEAYRLPADRGPVEQWWPWRGADIHLDRYVAPSPPATVIVLHGGGGYGRMLSPFGVAMNRLGYEVVAPDLPGYGLSVTPPEMFTHDHWVDCIVDLVDAELRWTGKPVVLLGMSVGGFLAYQAAAKSRKVSGVIATTLADARERIVQDQFSRFPSLTGVGVKLMPKLEALVGGWRLPIKWFANMNAITANPELAKVVNGDPCGGGNLVSVRFMRSLFTMQPAIEPEDFDLCPVLLAQPAADTWTTLEASLPVFDRIKGPKELVMLDNCGHFPIEEPGIGQLERAAAAFMERVSCAAAA
ncbi:MAG: alpha/beta hydrolase [Planctomycetia bacterium]|nr:alpha/beta hydrolase [Planctomycetia bacterium]